MNPVQPLRLGGPGVGVTPGSDQGPARASQVFQQPADHGGVGVLPAADDIGRDLDGGPVLADRPAAPVVVIALMAQPGLQNGRRRLQPLAPHGLPILADDEWIERTCHHRLETDSPLQIGVGQRPADVVGVVGIAVVHAAHRHDGR